MYWNTAAKKHLCRIGLISYGGFDTWLGEEFEQYNYFFKFLRLVFWGELELLYKEIQKVNLMSISSVCFTWRSGIGI